MLPRDPPLRLLGGGSAHQARRAGRSEGKLLPLPGGRRALPPPGGNHTPHRFLPSPESSILSCDCGARGRDGRQPGSAVVSPGSVPRGSRGEATDPLRSSRPHLRPPPCRAELNGHLKEEGCSPSQPCLLITEIPRKIPSALWILKEILSGLSFTSGIPHLRHREETLSVSASQAPCCSLQTQAKPLSLQLGPLGEALTLSTLCRGLLFKATWKL